MVVTFEDKEQLECVTKFVDTVLGIYDYSAVSTISALANKLHCAYTDKELSIDITEDFDAPYNDQLCCLYNICDLIARISADDTNAVIDMYNVLRKHYIKSDVPRFLEMLKEYKVPAEYCTGLFGHWCASEGLACLAEDCMDIQVQHNIIMTAVYEWVCHNDASPETDLHDEMNKYEEAINNGN